MLLLPPRAITRRILVSAVIIWLGLRFGAALVGWGTRTSVPLAGAIALLTVVLATLDIRRRSHHLFLENLGVSRLSVAFLTVCPPAVFELIWLLATIV